ncbi:hypothetical protein [Synechococcus sp. MIT S1220]|uniref:hypothetical protein n=1 Tax=Synechococcus sp. MIT S1220 TaxID=3082549 RepID=UPI0039AFBD96
MLLAEAAALPACKLICQLNPTTATRNGLPHPAEHIPPLRFTLWMAEGAQPIQIRPVNLIQPMAGLRHLDRHQPDRIGDTVHYQINAQAPASAFIRTGHASPDPGADISLIQGQLRLDPMRINFQLQLTMTPAINRSQASQPPKKPFNFSAQGICAERAIPAGDASEEPTDRRTHPPLH